MLHLKHLHLDIEVCFVLSYFYAAFGKTSNEIGKGKATTGKIGKGIRTQVYMCVIRRRKYRKMHLFCIVEKQRCWGGSRSLWYVHWTPPHVLWPQYTKQSNSSANGVDLLLGLKDAIIFIYRKYCHFTRKI